MRTIVQRHDLTKRRDIASYISAPSAEVAIELSDCRMGSCVGEEQRLPVFHCNTFAAYYMKTVNC
jgi:hypothetical protein